MITFVGDILAQNDHKNLNYNAEQFEEELVLLEQEVHHNYILD